MQKSFLAGMLAKTVWRVVEEDSSASGRAVPPQHACAQQGCARQARIPREAGARPPPQSKCSRNLARAAPPFDACLHLDC